MASPGFSHPPPSCLPQAGKPLHLRTEGTGKRGRSSWLTTPVESPVAEASTKGLIYCGPGLARRLRGDAPAWGQPSAKVLTHAYVSWVRGLTLGCPHGKCVLWRKPSPGRAGRPSLVGPVCPRLKNVFWCQWSAAPAVPETGLEQTQGAPASRHTYP